VENIKNGRLMPVEVQTVKALHPQLHAQIGQEMLQSLADKGERPTMQKRMAYAMWTGDTQSDPTLRMLPMLQAPSPFGDKPSGQQGPGMAKKSRASPKSPALQKIAARYAPPGASEGSEA
jgi:hypothetical protein